MGSRGSKFWWPWEWRVGVYDSQGCFIPESFFLYRVLPFIRQALSLVMQQHHLLQPGQTQPHQTMHGSADHAVLCRAVPPAVLCSCLLL